ncbi:MAG: hypothetical protein ABL931_11585 [Usitatibacteraceae bacterium]
MKLSKMVISTSAALAVVGAVGFAYAQTNPENINVKGPSNLTQTQSDAALPCQPGPFNPHLPKDTRGTASRNGTTGSNTTADCATVSVAPVRVSAPTPVVAQSDAVMPNQPAPVTPAPTAYTPAPQTTMAMDNTMTTEREPQADRN